MGKEIIESIYNYIINNKGKFFGSICGLIVAILILTIGFLKTLLICIFVGLGRYIGIKRDAGLTFKELIIIFINKINKEYM